jgi:hypothetical protein
MEYESQPSGSDKGLEQDDVESVDSELRAQQLRREDMLEYEIRRLEQLNLETAQRLKEPQTTDSDKEDFNLLSNDTELLMPRRISNLEDTTPLADKADEDEINNRDSQPSPVPSFKSPSP